MMTTMICTVCSEPKVVTSRSVVLPYVCDECQGRSHRVVKFLGLKVEESDNHACDSATVENTTLLIEDQANQLALAKNEVEALRQIVQYLEAREIALTAQVENRQNQVENLLVKNFFKDEKISGLAKQNERLGIAGFQQSVRTLGLWAKPHPVQNYQNFVGMLDQQPASFYENWTPASISQPDVSSSSIPPSEVPMFRSKWRDTIATLLQRMATVLVHMKEGRPLTLRHGESTSTAGPTCDEASTVGS
jgi:hypothetical protein